MPNEMPKVSNRYRIQVVHHRKVTPSSDIAVECVELSFWRGGILPEPVLDIDTPVHDVWVVDVLRQLLTQAYSDGTEGWAEVSRCQRYVSGFLSTGTEGV